MQKNNEHTQENMNNVFSPQKKSKSFTKYV